jgi:hypothetical protein
LEASLRGGRSNQAKRSLSPRLLRKADSLDCFDRSSLPDLAGRKPGRHEVSRLAYVGNVRLPEDLRPCSFDQHGINLLSVPRPSGADPAKLGRQDPSRVSRQQAAEGRAEPASLRFGERISGACRLRRRCRDVRVGIRVCAPLRSVRPVSTSGSQHDSNRAGTQKQNVPRGHEGGQHRSVLKHSKKSSNVED